MFVFRFGKIYTYDETYADPKWNYEQLCIAASTYATFRHHTIDENEAYTLAFMYVTMELEPEIDYSKSYSSKIKSLFSLVEKA